MIELSRIGKVYGDGQSGVLALRDVDLQVDANEYVAVTGPSGSGKSTLMNIIGCLDTATSGSYRLNGRNVSSCDEAGLAEIRNRHIGFVFQNFQLRPRASALQNVAQPLIYRGVPPSEREALAARMLARLGLAERQHHTPPQLSGGQRQRVAIARALVGRPAVLLADEPTGNLDEHSAGEIMDILEGLHRDGMTIMVVTHNEEVARRCCRRVRVRNGRLDP
jgi:putative ABC transport system ATP-binding protein